MIQPYQPMDVDVLHPASTFHAVMTGDLLTLGWHGGQIVQFAGGFNPITVSRSDGNAVAGFLQRGSAEANTDWTNMQVLESMSPHVMKVTHDNGIFSFRYFETMDATFRATGVGFPLVYAANAELYVSENGYLTCDIPADLIAQSGIASPILVGHAIAAVSGGRLPVQYQF